MTTKFDLGSNTGGLSLLDMINEPNFWKVPRLTQEFILDPVQADVKVSLNADVNAPEYFYDVWKLFSQLGWKFVAQHQFDVCSSSF